MEQPELAAWCWSRRHCFGAQAGAGRKGQTWKNMDLAARKTMISNSAALE